MKWVDTRYELPAPHRRVLVTMQEVQYWAPIASTPRRGK